MTSAEEKIVTFVLSLTMALKFHVNTEADSYEISSSVFSENIYMTRSDKEC